MNTTEVEALLEANNNPRGIENWEKLGGEAAKLKSYGVGLTQLRKLAKRVGRDHDLAMKLWNSDVYDAKVIALLVDDPEVMTRDQAEEQVEKVGLGNLSHVFSSCDATLAKTPFVVELAEDWIVSDDPVRRSCGYGLLYELSKSTKKNAPDDAFFLDKIEHMRASYDAQAPGVRGSIGGALLGIGKRNAALNAAALALARELGPIQFDETGGCDPMDVAKHLTSDWLKDKLGL